jgi:hypothetical protein
MKVKVYYRIISIRLEGSERNMEMKAQLNSETKSNEKVNYFFQIFIFNYFLNVQSISNRIQFIIVLVTFHELTFNHYPQKPEENKTIFVISFLL